MQIGYDTKKNQKNIVERGLPFDDVVFLDWEQALIRVDDRKDYGEVRYNAFATGEDGKAYSVTFTLRGDIVWIISFRRAREKERRLYEQRS
ncbi:BrnT family toxin [Crocosphaera sp. Alani8]|uniref:BrnT family toxin n=1 Tax=Crocosphaera sp. Alani8 TaxID=3038952 RepID=UPI00313ADAB0